MQSGHNEAPITFVTFQCGGRSTLSPLAPTAIGGVEATHAAQFRDPDVADRAYIAAMVYHVVKRSLCP